MQFIYNGRHLAGEPEVNLFSYENGVRVWVKFDDAESKYQYQIKVMDELVTEFPKLELCEAFIEGMKKTGLVKGFKLVEEEQVELPKDAKALQDVIRAMTVEMDQLKKDKDKAQKLAEKMVKGVMKNKASELEKNIQVILEKHVDDL